MTTAQKGNDKFGEVTLEGVTYKLSPLDYKDIQALRDWAGSQVLRLARESLPSGARSGGMHYEAVKGSCERSGCPCNTTAPTWSWKRWPGFSATPAIWTR